MHFPVFLTAASLCLATLTKSSPLLDRRQTIEPPSLYYLQTKVVNGDHEDCGTDKNNLWLYSHHTGAGTGIGGLSSNKSWAMEAYLEDSQQLFTYEGNQDGPWPLAIANGPYQQWNPVTISIASSPTTYQGFFFNSSGLQLNTSSDGWLACDWWHGVPQLFNLNGYTYGPVATSCSKVQLFPVAV